MKSNCLLHTSYMLFRERSLLEMHVNKQWTSNGVRCCINDSCFVSTSCDKILNIIWVEGYINEKVVSYLHLVVQNVLLISGLEVT